MWFVARLLLKVVANTAALWFAQQFISGLSITPHTFPVLNSIHGLSPFWQTLLVSGVILTLLNIILRPVLTIISLPLTVITFGLWHIVINMAILGLAHWLLPELAISGFVALFLGSLFISIVNMIFK